METRCSRQLVLMAAVVAATCLMAHPRSAAGQARNAFGVGAMRSVGSQSGFGSSTFRQYSYGLGGAAAPGAGSTIGARNTSIRRSGAAAGAGGTGSVSSRGSTTTGTRALYKASTIRISAGGGGGSVGASFQQMLTNRTRLGQSLRGTFGLTESPLLTDEPIATFAPDNPGHYANYLRNGEKAMKIRQYAKATEQFRRANYIGSRRAETLLSLAHADFAQGKYASMAYYLRLTIRYFPDLAGKTIQLRKFFRDAGEFVLLRDNLIARTQRWPADANQWLALAYVQWFDGNIEKASDAMRNAMAASTDPRLTEAVDSLWDSCVATGKVTGALIESPPTTSQPASKVEPAEKADPPKVAHAGGRAEPGR